MNDTIAALTVAAAAVALAAARWYSSDCAMRTPLFTDPVDPYAPYEPLTKCDPVSRKGVELFRDWVIGSLGGADLGIVRACEPGSAATSKHHEGRAWDWGPPSQAAANQLLDCLMASEAGQKHALARRAGLRVIIWNRRIWTPRDGGSWEAYDKSPHTDHIHFGFSWDGARGTTSLQAALRAQQPQLSQPTASGSEVAPKLTPLTETELLAALAKGHVQTFGVRPNYSRLGMAWSQACLETGHTLRAYNHNWGNVKRTSSWPGDYFQYPNLGESNPYFRSYPDAVSGAADYWRVLSHDRYAAALAAFDGGDPHDAADQLRTAGYYTAPLAGYADTLAKLFAEYRDKFPPPHCRIAPLVLGSLAAVGAVYIGRKC